MFHNKLGPVSLRASMYSIGRYQKLVARFPRNANTALIANDLEVVVKIEVIDLRQLNTHRRTLGRVFDPGT